MSRQQIKKQKANLQTMLNAFDEEVPKNPQAVEVPVKESDLEEFKEFLDKDSSVPKLGNVVKGAIVEIQGDRVIVDIRYKSEGVIDLKQFLNVEDASVGQEVEAVVESLEADSGLILLSKEKADMLRYWDRVCAIHARGEVVEGRVLSKIKGGYSVDIGIKAFLPHSQIELGASSRGSDISGKTLSFKVVKFNKKRGNVILSRRAVLEESLGRLQSERSETLEVGNVVKGIVKNITEYGVFVDLGGMDGLLHVSDISWSRAESSTNSLENGQEIEVKVLKLNKEKSRVSLGLKQLQEDPWASVSEKYPLNTEVTCKVAKVINYGAFVSLSDGMLDGFIHVADLSWGNETESAESVLSEGQEVQAMVVGYNDENRRVRLSIKHLTESPWKKIAEEYSVGDVIEGQVDSVSNFGIFVAIQDGVSGLVHQSDFSWTESFKPESRYKVGETVKAVVLGVDVDNQKIRLGIKQLEANPWDTVRDKYAVGTVCKVKVVKTSEFGAFVDLESGIGGLIHISELSSSRIESVEDVLSVGQEVEAEIISLDVEARKIGLSLKSLQLSEQKKVLKALNGESASRLGDVISGDLRESLVQASKSDDKSDEGEDS